MTAAFTLGLIINTYNQPDYLSRVLEGISRQTVLPGEVLLADDGSGDETRRLFQEWGRQKSIRSTHIWQEHAGFRRSRILNQAIASAQSDYLVFLDGDTIPHPRFIEDHRALRTPRQFVQGHRALVEQKAAVWFGQGAFARDRRRALWQGQLRGLKHAFRWPVPSRRVRSDLKGIRGCNLAIERGDLLEINGYNEAFTGWGREDSELAVRLMNSGVRRLDVRGWSLCYHLWHAPASRDGLNRNDDLLAQAIATQSRRCEAGVSQYQAKTKA